MEIAVETLQTPVLGVGDIDIETGGGAQVAGFVELFLVKTESAYLDQKIAVRAELLDPVVARIGDVDVSLRIQGDALRLEKLASSAAGRADHLEKAQSETILPRCSLSQRLLILETGSPAGGL